MSNFILHHITRFVEWIIEKAPEHVGWEYLICHLCGQRIADGHYVRCGELHSHVSCHDKQLLPPVPPASSGDTVAIVTRASFLRQAEGWN
jgi:hypothetical protein